MAKWSRSPTLLPPWRPPDYWRLLMSMAAPAPRPPRRERSSALQPSTAQRSPTAHRRWPTPIEIVRFEKTLGGAIRSRNLAVRSWQTCPPSGDIAVNHPSRPNEVDDGLGLSRIVTGPRLGTGVHGVAEFGFPSWWSADAPVVVPTLAMTGNDGQQAGTRVDGVLVPGDGVRTGERFARTQGVIS
jgi:hypothetical protein